MCSDKALSNTAASCVVVFLRVVDSSVAGRHGTLHDDNLLGFPHAQHRHTRNLRVGIILRGAIDSVVCCGERNKKIQY